VPELENALRESAADWLVADTTIFSAGFAGKQVGQVTAASTCTELACARCRQSGEEMLEPQTALMFYTSGTTGTPKCVIHSHRSMAESITSLAESMELTSGTIALTPLAPMLPAALGTVVLQALCTGATLALATSHLPKKILSRVTDLQPAVFFAVPYVYRLLTLSGPADMQAMWARTRLCLSSSATLENKLFDEFLASTGRPIRSLYCSSEIGSCTFNSSSDPEHVRRSVGEPLRGVQVHIVDEEGLELPPGRVGQILVGGTHLASGYFRRPDLQARVFATGRVKTGDLGELDVTGSLSLRGRLSNTINISGYLVNPEEVEQVLLTHPAITDALVYGRDDSRLGEAVAAKIIVRDGCLPPTKEALLDLCAQCLTHYKIPRQIDFVAALPRSRYGKLKRG